jgi:Na+-transporting methylmalonyl-CoA/oxaloacetate decarboxylase gamma subunit
MVTTRTMGDVLHYFRLHVRQLRAKVPASDPNAKAMTAALDALEAAINKHAQVAGLRRRSMTAVVLLCLLLLAAMLWATAAFGLVTMPLPSSLAALAPVHSNPSHQAASTAAVVLISALLTRR